MPGKPCIYRLPRLPFENADFALIVVDRGNTAAMTPSFKGLPVVSRVYPSGLNSSSQFPYNVVAFNFGNTGFHYFYVGLIERKILI